MKERVEVMISSEEISKRLEEIAKQVQEDFHGEQIELVCVLKGGVVTMVELAKKLRMPVTMNFMDVSSYGDGTESSGHIKILRDLDEDITGKNVLLVEDIIDSGRTLGLLRTLLIQRNPKLFKICTLLDKPDRRVTQVPVDYVGFTIPDAFVVGYGLDYAQKYRNLDYVGVVHFEEE
ncbi:MAG TPA: hypoxanthine phosphoribosyltransferase [Candidatus Anaerotignum merdipullorum]|nr:hypoxanthine phosphoribosyltransferase [Candidatus Anaerotignum merdipullorum]